MHPVLLRGDHSIGISAESISSGPSPKLWFERVYRSAIGVQRWDLLYRRAKILNTIVPDLDPIRKIRSGDFEEPGFGFFEFCDGRFGLERLDERGETGIDSVATGEDVGNRDTQIRAEALARDDRRIGSGEHRDSETAEGVLKAGGEEGRGVAVNEREVVKVPAAGGGAAGGLVDGDDDIADGRKK